MNLNKLQKSNIFKFLSSYFAFVFIVLQVVDILSEPFSLSKHIIIYLVYVFAAILVLIIIFALKVDRKSKNIEPTEKESQNRLIVPVSLSIIVILLIMNGYQFFSTKTSSLRMAELSSSLDKFIAESNYLASYHLYKEYSDHPAFLNRLEEFTNLVNISSSVSGVKGYLKNDLDKLSESSWELLCDLPCDVRIPKGRLKYKFQKDGYKPVERLESIRDSLSIDLFQSKSYSDNMVFIEEANIKLRVAGLDHLESEPLGSYYIDKYEVTNDDYEKFIAKGGYDKDSLWAFRELSDVNYKKLFIDKTGFNGPSNWELGTYPDNNSNHPVSGISWFEAMAYCRSMGKSLPNIYQWDYSASLVFSADIIPRSNIQTESKTAIGEKRIISRFGLYDVAGNVSEWINNESDNSSKVIMGGSWKDPGYIFNTLFNKDPFNRDEANGCRCVISSEKNNNLFRKVSNPSLNLVNAKPVDDDVFAAYLSMFKYSNYDQQARTVKDTLHQADNYKIQKISYNTPYGEKMFAYIYIPDSLQNPAKTIVYFPGAFAINRKSSSRLFKEIPPWMKFFIKINSVVVYPVYASTYERRDGLINSIPFFDLSYRDRVIKWSKDLQATVDYLTTADYVDTNDIHYLGFSWGARLSGIMLATEERFKSAVIIIGGLRSQKRHPEADPVNFLPRVKIPILMLNGKYDPIFPFKTRVMPMFDLFGTPKSNKTLISYEGGHSYPGHEQIKKVIEWFDSTN